MDENLIRQALPIFTQNDIELILKIFRWTKAERNPNFHTETLKRFPKYKKGLKRLQNKFFLIYQVKHGIWRINEDLVRIGKLLLELRYREII